MWIWLGGRDSEPVRAECNEARRFPTAVPTGRRASNEVVSEMAGRQGFGTVRAECNKARRFPTAVPTGRRASNEVVSEMAGRQGFEPRYRGPEIAKEASVILECFAFLRKIPRIVGPSPVGDGPFVRNLSSSCQDFQRRSSAVPNASVRPPRRQAQRVKNPA
jgi:hypothetical protein